MRFLAYRNNFLFENGLCSVRLDGDGNTLREALGAKEDLACLKSLSGTIKNDVCVDLRVSLDSDIVSKSEVIGNIAFVSTENVEEAKWAEEIKAGFANVQAVIIDGEPGCIGDSVLTNLDTSDGNLLFPFFSQNVNVELAVSYPMAKARGLPLSRGTNGHWASLIG